MSSSVISSICNEIQKWWKELGFSEYSTEIAIKNNFVFVNFKFNIDEEENVKTIFESHGEGLYETFVVDHVSNRSLFVKKLVEKFPSGKIRSYESFPIEKSDLFRIGSAEITIEIKEFET